MFSEVIVECLRPFFVLFSWRETKSLELNLRYLTFDWKSGFQISKSTFSLEVVVANRGTGFSGNLRIEVLALGAWFHFVYIDWPYLMAFGQE
jgi:hypothetical protein